MKHNFGLYFLLTLATACNQNSQNQNDDSGDCGNRIIRLEANDSIDHFPNGLEGLRYRTGEIVDLFSKVELIPLENKVECMLSNVERMIPFENKYYVLTNNPHPQVFVFDEDGKFSNKIGMYGHGHGEYQHIYDLLIDEEKRHVVVLLWNGQESAVNVYNFDGTFIESKSLSESPGVILGVNTPDGYVFSTAQYHEEGKLDSLIYICDKSFKVKKKLISSEEKSVVGILPPKNFLQYAEGKVIYFDKFTNRLFLIDMEHEDYNVVPYMVDAPKLCEYEHYCDMSWRFDMYDEISSFAFNGHDILGRMCVKGMNHNFKFDFRKNVFHVDKGKPGFAPDPWLSYKNGVYYGMFSPEEFGSHPWGIASDDSHSHENNTYNFIEKQMSKYPNQENLVIVKMKANPNFPERQL